MEFLAALFVFPILSFLVGIIGKLLLKNTYAVVLITFGVWIITAYMVFNSSFLIWVFVYTGLSALGAGAANLVKR